MGEDQAIIMARESMMLSVTLAKETTIGILRIAAWLLAAIKSGAAHVLEDINWQRNVQKDIKRGNISGTVFAVPDQQTKQFEALAKEYGIVFAKVKDHDLTDSCTDYMIRTTDTFKLEHLIESRKLTDVREIAHFEPVAEKPQGFQISGENVDLSSIEVSSFDGKDLTINQKPSRLSSHPFQPEMTEESPLLRDSKSTPAIDQKEIKDPATITKDAKRFSFMERLGHYKAEIAKNKDILMPTLEQGKDK